MALALRNLVVGIYARGFTQWVYLDRTASLQDICKPGFFNDAGDMIQPGDMATISAKDGGATIWFETGPTTPVVMSVAQPGFHHLIYRDMGDGK